ncbi:hypothetical protein C7474_0789 [Microbacterium telephonicum]|uniref:Lipoprotein n=2 Tax=Microbacterium telephonicum TaxID=1714841 RepID=A0A498CLI1_9MICO|nr:hypothetical protein C7474_0789 [Microbacterium telephonicum]
MRELARDRRSRRTGRLAALAVLALTPLALAGCAGFQVFGLGQSQECASWVDYLTEDRMADDADVVAVVTDVTSAGTERLMGFDANAYTVTVADAVTGDVEPGEEMRVVSTADTCAAHPYGEGDPMLGGATLRLYLVQDGDVLRTLTPFAGVVVEED